MLSISAANDRMQYADTKIHCNVKRRKERNANNTVKTTTRKEAKRTDRREGFA